MDYLDPCGYFNDLYEEPFPNGCSNYGDKFGEMMDVNINEIEVYEKAVYTFIEFLEKKQDDNDWLLENQVLVSNMFTERRGFSLAEVLTALVIASMVLVTVLGIYSRA